MLWFAEYMLCEVVVGLLRNAGAPRHSGRRPPGVSDGVAGTRDCAGGGPGRTIRMIEAKIAEKFKRQYAKLPADEVMVLASLNKRLKAKRAAA